MAEVKTCGTCEYDFVPEEGYEYQSQCIVCWKKEKGFKLIKADTAHERLQKHLAERETELRKKVDAAEKRAKAAERKAEKAVKAANEAKGKADASTSDLGCERLSAARIKGLILLCHPDRHDNSKLSNELTKWLLDLRKTP